MLDEIIEYFEPSMSIYVIEITRSNLPDYLLDKVKQVTENMEVLKSGLEEKGIVNADYRMWMIQGADGEPKTIFGDHIERTYAVKITNDMDGIPWEEYIISHFDLVFDGLYLGANIGYHTPEGKSRVFVYNSPHNEEGEMDLVLVGHKSKVEKRLKNLEELLFMNQTNFSAASHID